MKSKTMLPKSKPRKLTAVESTKPEPELKPAKIEVSSHPYPCDCSKCGMEYCDCSEEERGTVMSRLEV
jgi:hypothetical protein